MVLEWYGRMGMNFTLPKKFDSNFLQSLMGGVKTKLRAIADRGVLASYKK
jgi:hypothetical protein